jgi:hypothetical protein
MSINLHIERLILDDLPLTLSQGALVRAALERELARMLTESGLPERSRAGGAVPYAPAQRFDLAPGERPDRIGLHIARSIYRGLGGVP